MVFVWEISSRSHSCQIPGIELHAFYLPGFCEVSEQLENRCFVFLLHGLYLATENIETDTQHCKGVSRGPVETKKMTLKPSAKRLWRNLASWTSAKPLSTCCSHTKISELKPNIAKFRQTHGKCMGMNQGQQCEDASCSNCAQKTGISALQSAWIFYSNRVSGLTCWCRSNNCSRKVNSMASPPEGNAPSGINQGIALVGFKPRHKIPSSAAQTFFQGKPFSNIR